jgi:hypothetical protein
MTPEAPPGLFAIELGNTVARWNELASDATFRIPLDDDRSGRHARIRKCNRLLQTSDLHDNNR